MIKENSSFIVLYLEDLSATALFYKSLGLDIKPEGDYGITINLGGLEIHYVLVDSEKIPEYLPIAIQEPGGPAIHYFEVNSLPKFLAKAIEAGGEILTDITENHWGAREFLFQDPAGYIFAAYQMK